MKDTLSIIQLGAKIARIVSKVLMVIGIVAGASCVLGIISLAVIGAGSVNLLGVDFHSLVEVEAGVPLETAYISMATGIIMCLALALNGGFTTSFFKKELEAGTPFDFGIAKGMFKLGIIIMAVTLGATILAGISEEIMNNIMGLDYSSELDIGGSFTTGLMFFAMSFVCKYGAEVSGKAKAIEEK